jgi:hypothetical protein
MPTVYAVGLSQVGKGVARTRRESALQLGVMLLSLLLVGSSMATAHSRAGRC